MAMSRKIKLRPLKLTVWIGSGTPTTKLVHRGLRTVQEEPSGSNSAVATGLCKDMASDADDGDMVVVESTVQEQQSHTSETYIVEPSHYEIEKKQQKNIGQILGNSLSSLTLRNLCKSVLYAYSVPRQQNCVARDVDHMFSTVAQVFSILIAM